MHPAPSLILFTVLSGLGFGLIAALGLGLPPVTGGVALAFYAIAFALAGSGLAASLFHLGHPERALLAFTQWRSSWLSREAWAASATLAVTALHAALIVLADLRVAPLGWLTAALALATVAATAMIYTQIRAVPRWHRPEVPALFLVQAVAGGALLAGQVTSAIVLLLLLGAVQVWTWIAGDRAWGASATTIGTATGLGARGAVRSFEWPHTGPNYLTREMVHVVGRRHAATLRIIGLALLAPLPVLILLLPFSHLAAGVAVLCHLLGAIVCRWLFYAQAEHVVGLYYGLRTRPQASETA